MSLPWIRKAYGVPAFRGRMVRFEGTIGFVTSAAHAPHVSVRLLDGIEQYGLRRSQVSPFHPTWHMDYFNPETASFDCACEIATYGGGKPCDCPCHKEPKS